MSQNLADDAAVLVHPQKAFVLRHIPVPERYDEHWDDSQDIYASVATNNLSMWPDLEDYVGRLHAAVETLFGSVDFDMHRSRGYPSGELTFHNDMEEFLDDEVLRMVTCVHNATDEVRSLTFARPTWTNHTETFALTIPARAILAFGGSLITDYEHGIPADPSVVTYRSIVTRFCRYAEE